MCQEINYVIRNCKLPERYYDGGCDNYKVPSTRCYGNAWQLGEIDGGGALGQPRKISKEREVG